MKILAIESSCDETAAAVVADEGRILSNVVVSQVDIFAAYGGVIPEVAARSHLEAILPVVRKALADAGVTKDEIDYVAVTHTPGLMGSLMIGTLTARMLAILWQKPLYAVHHLKSHIYANWLKDMQMEGLQSSSREPLDNPSSRVSRSARRASTRFYSLSEDCNPSTDILQSTDKGGFLDGGRINRVPEFPLLALVVSGGHTQIIYMEAHNKFEIIGTTRDDAVGECFDKVAKILGLPYPGGPSIAKCATGIGPTSSSESVNLSKSSSSSRDFDSVQPENTPQMMQDLSQLRTCNFGKVDPRQSENNSQNMQSFAKSPVGDLQAYKLPHPKVEWLDFSFSGLKTAVLRAVQAELGLPITTPSYELAAKLTAQQRADFAASFQEVAAEILVEKLEMALEKYPEVKSIVLAGGVSANEVLKEKALELAAEERKVYFPELKFAGDNAAMVGAAAYYEIITGVEPTDPYKLSIAPRTDIG